MINLCVLFMIKIVRYDTVCPISGVLQQYMPRCVVGGRVMTATNSMYHVKHNRMC